jgi:hypothetical protein
MLDSTWAAIAAASALAGCFSVAVVVVFGRAVVDVVRHWDVLVGLFGAVVVVVVLAVTQVSAVWEASVVLVEVAGVENGRREQPLTTAARVKATSARTSARLWKSREARFIG